MMDDQAQTDPVAVKPLGQAVTQASAVRRDVGQVP